MPEIQSNFDRAVKILQSESLDSLSNDDWDILGNILQAYIWDDEFTHKLKQIEKDYLESRKNSDQEMVKELKGRNIRLRRQDEMDEEIKRAIASDLAYKLGEKPPCS